MKFRGLRPITNGDIAKEIQMCLQDLFLGLRNKLTFGDNFDGFIVEMEVIGGTETVVTNQLNSVPSGFLVLQTYYGSTPALMAQGSVWNSSQVSIYSFGGGGVSSKIKVLFLR